MIVMKQRTWQRKENMDVYQTIQGHPVFCEVRHADANATPAVFVHGAGGSHQIWRQQFDLLKERPAYFVDLPGHGQSGGEALTSVKEMAEWLSEWLKQAVGEKPVILVGHSMGGAITQWMALHHPQQIKAIILVTTGARLKVNPQFLNDLEQGIYDPSSMRRSFSPHTDERIIEAEIERRKGNVSVEVLRNDYLACNAFDLRNDIHRISCPTLIIAGEDDQSTPPFYSTYMAEQIPGAKLVILPKSGHYVMLEQTERFNQELLSFINRF